MSLLYRTLYAWKCKGTHHKLAMDALTQLRCKNAEQWRNLFLRNIESYLQGSKAPDKQFKDFRNHVLHVQDNYWGGAERLAVKWYEATVNALRAGDWKQAIYSAGVLSHYYTDPIQPFHTAQSDEEGKIHRAAEWSISCSYDLLKQMLEEELGGYPHVPMPHGDDWLPEMVRQGAETSNPHYQTLIDHYDFKKGIKKPPEGLDRTFQEVTALLIGYAAVGFARILERAIDDAGVDPPNVGVSLMGMLSACTIPIFWITKKMADVKERKVVEAMYAELQATGNVEKTLPEDDRQIRQLYHTEVLKKSPPESEPKVAEKSPSTLPITTEREQRVEQPQEPRFYLNLDDPSVDAPSIGPKTAKHLEKVGVRKVSDLLKLKPEKAASLLNMRYITAETILEWQDQATLACCIPFLRGHDAQILVAVGITQPEFLTSMQPEDLLAIVKPFVKTAEGQRILRNGKHPDLAEVTDWITWATQARPLKAA